MCGHNPILSAGPIMKAAPNAYFAEGMIVFGSPGKGGIAAKGFVLQPPDLRGGSVAYVNAYQDKIRNFLGNLGPGCARSSNGPATATTSRN